MTGTPPADLLELDARHVWHPFTQAATAPEPTLIERGRGAHLYTRDGRVLLDLISSWWVNLHGHAHPRITAAISEQAARLEQVIFAGFTHEGAVRLAEHLARLLPGDLSRVFYTDNGSSAVEAALKIAQQYWHNHGTPRRRLLALDGGYHGDTFGAMSAGRSSGFYTPFEDKLFDVTFLPCPHTHAGDADVQEKEAASLRALDAYLERHGADTAAIILEPLVQGATGMRMTRPAFLDALLARVRAHGALVILDEVMTGFGRTGTLFAAHQLQVAPDLVCLSKGITGGFLPLAVTVATERVYEAFLGGTFDRAFAHGHSYTANPLGCAAALASLELLLDGSTQENIRTIQEAHERNLTAWQAHPHLTRARVTGTITAVDFKHLGAYGGAGSLRLRDFFVERGLLLRPLGNVAYLLPPYCVTQEELRRAYDAVLEAADLFGPTAGEGKA